MEIDIVFPEESYMRTSGVAQSRYSWTVVELTEFGQDIFCLLPWVH